MNEIKWPKLTIGAILGYLISWMYFFITLPILTHLLGKITGIIVNYGLACLVWIVVIYIIHSFEFNMYNF
jgi:hypothetical protein